MNQEATKTNNRGMKSASNDVREKSKLRSFHAAGGENYV